MWSPRVNLRPRRPGNFTDIDVATRVDCEAVRRKELSEFGPCRRVAEAADQFALMIDNTDPRPEIGNITADGIDDSLTGYGGGLERMATQP